MKIANLFTVALVALTLFSCSEENVNEPNVIVEGTPTTARIMLTQKSSAGTRATDAATAAESAINSANVYIFKNDGMLEKIVAFEAADITAGSKVFAITAGAKYVYATINIPADQLTGIVENSTSKTNFEKQLIGISTTDPGAGFWMSNVGDGEAVNLAAGVTTPSTGNNSVTVNVGRTSAKVNLALATTPVVVGGAFQLSEFKMMSNPLKNYLMPAKNAAGKRIAPFYAETTVVTGNYYNQTSYAANASDVYVTENIHETPLMGNTTYAIIKGVFTPAVVLDANGVASTSAANNDFWRIQKTDGTFTADYYSAEPTATEVAAKGGDSIVKYDLGVAYYRLYVADNSKANASEKYAVLRNNYYKISIVSVNGAGSNTESGVVPGTPNVPVEEATNMEAVISVLPWSVVDQSGGI